MQYEYFIHGLHFSFSYCIFLKSRAILGNKVILFPLRANSTWAFSMKPLPISWSRKYFPYFLLETIEFMVLYLVQVPSKINVCVWYDIRIKPFFFPNTDFQFSRSSGWRNFPSPMAWHSCLCWKSIDHICAGLVLDSILLVPAICLSSHV